LVFGFRFSVFGENIEIIGNLAEHRTPNTEHRTPGFPMARDRRDKGDSDSRDQGMVDFVVKIKRSACVVKGGRRFSFNALVVVGDKQGRVSFGYGKANEVPPSVEKAIKEGEQMARRAKKVQMRGDTIPHRVIGRFGASKV